MSNNWINYHHLYYFKTIAEEGGIAKAAAKLKLGQPTLSAQLKQFEQNIGSKLFEREHRKLVLTETGRVVLEYAKEIFKLGNEMLESLLDRPTAEKIHIQIGTLDSLPKTIILRLARSAHEITQCSLTISEGKRDNLLPSLLDHQLDLVILNYMPTYRIEVDKLLVRNFGRLPIIVCAAPKFSKLKKGFPGSLAGKPFILPMPDNKLRHDVEHFFKLNNIPIQCAIEIGDTGAQKLFAIEEMGLVAISKLAVEEHLKSGELVELGQLPEVYEDLFLVTAKRKIENPLASKLFKSFKL